MKLRNRFFQTAFSPVILLLTGCSVAVAPQNATAPSIITLTMTPTFTLTATATHDPNLDVPTRIPARNGWKPDYVSVIPIASLDTKSQSEIAYLLFDSLLAHFKTPDADSRNGLVDYAILNVQAEPDLYSQLAVEQEVDFVATAIYSVRPTILMYSNWVAGNGDVAFQSGWINQKSLFIGIYHENGTYRIKILGTG
jgi:hypothetical protein